MTILIAGPYRGGTNDDPVLIQKNMDRLEEAVIPLYEKGHLPLIGEWVAMPIMKKAGFKKIGDDVWNKYQYPVAHKLLELCDAVYRIPGESKGADGDVQRANELGLKTYYNLKDIPDEK